MSPVLDLHALTAADSIETLLIVAFFVFLSGISNWLKRKGGPTGNETSGPGLRPGPRQASPTPPASGPPSPAGRPSFDWQEELRRLLTGEVEEPAATVPPPPLVGSQPYPTAPPPLGPSLGRGLPPPAESPAPVWLDRLGTLAESKAAYERGGEVDVMATQEMRQRAGLADSASRYQRVRHLDEEVALHLRQVTSRPVQLTTIVRHEAQSAEIAQGIGWARRPRAARQAIIASVILAPPKGLEL